MMHHDAWRHQRKSPFPWNLSEVTPNSSYWPEIMYQHPSLPTRVGGPTIAKLRSSFLCLTSMLLGRWSRQAYHGLNWKLWLSTAKYFINASQAFVGGRTSYSNISMKHGGVLIIPPCFMDKMYLGIYVFYCFSLPLTLISVFSVFVLSVNPVTLGSSCKFLHIASTATSDEGRVQAIVLLAERL